ncbi:MAG: TetR family transcriptional regulator [Chloroflexi bacterium]|nr:TetR family transcriptional regulator [Chloroflexota bacterium]
MRSTSGAQRSSANKPAPRGARVGQNGTEDGQPTLKRVHSAARARFADQGYAAASMRQIAADAGISLGTLFFHCPTKERLLFDALMDSLRELCDALQLRLQVAGSTWRERLAEAFALHIEFSARQAFGTTFSAVDMLNLTPEHRAEYIALRASYERQFRELIRWGIAAGEFRPVDAKLASFALLGVGQTVGRWFRADGALTPDQIAAEYIDLIFNGLSVTHLERDESGVRLRS